MNKSWIAGGLVGLVLLGLFASGVPGRTVRWYRQVATWEATVTADSLRRVQDGVARDSITRVLAAREARVAQRERRDSATALALASQIAALHSTQDLPDTCQPAIAERDSVISVQQDLLGRKAMTIVDLIDQVKSERSLRLRLEIDTTNLRSELRMAKVVIRAAPVRPSFWERIRPGVYGGYGAAGDPAGVRTGPAILVGWKIL